MSYKSITEEQYSKITLAYNKLCNEDTMRRVRQLELETQSNYLKNMFDELKEDMCNEINIGDLWKEEDTEDWVYWNTNSEDVDYQHYQHYIRNMSSAEIRIVIAEIQKHFKDEYDMSVFETYSDEEITKYAVCYCGIFISKLKIDENL